MGESSAPARSGGGRVLVIGLDGATFTMLDQWMGRGLMPNLKQLVGAGARAVMKSVMPPVTAPAWASFSTGAGPGYHGVFDFWRQAPGQFRRRLVTAEDLRVPPIWRTLTEAGLKVGLVNVPVSYPPSPDLSFAISEWLVPSGAPRFTQPAGLFEELRPALGDYVVEPPLLNSNEVSAVAQYVAEIRHLTLQQTLYTTHLMKTRPWDFCFTVLMATDWLQHRLWDVLAEDSSDPERVELRRIAEELVGVVDDQIGALRAACPEGTDVFIVSDHGFGPLRRRFKVNQWLASQGLLRPSLRHRVGRWLRRTGLMKLRQLLRRRGRQPGGMHQTPVWRWVDWAGTKAYASSQSDLGIHVNLAGREAAGSVALGDEYEQVRTRVLEALAGLRDPKTGKPLVSLAARREELFPGPHVEGAPDVVYLLEDGECLASLRLDGALLEASNWYTWTGVHRIEGVFAAAGPSIQPGRQLPDIRIVDVAPAILRILGLAAPEQMEGRIPEGLLTPEVEAMPVRSVQPGPSGGPEGPQGGYSEEEAREVEERLRGLGYL
jgi:predicted AlkP superfamily phosphohydrolase/phosphomutase